MFDAGRQARYEGPHSTNKRSWVNAATLWLNQNSSIHLWLMIQWYSKFHWGHKCQWLEGQRGIAFHWKSLSKLELPHCTPWSAHQMGTWSRKIAPLTLWSSMLPARLTLRNCSLYHSSLSSSVDYYTSFVFLLLFSFFLNLQVPTAKSHPEYPAPFSLLDPTYCSSPTSLASTTLTLSFPSPPHRCSHQLPTPHIYSQCWVFPKNINKVTYYVLVTWPLWKFQLWWVTWSWALFLTPLGLSFVISVIRIRTAPLYKVFLRSQWVNMCRGLRTVFDTYSKPSKCLFYSALKMTSTLHARPHLIHMTAMWEKYYYLYSNWDLSSSRTHIFYIIIKKLIHSFI